MAIRIRVINGKYVALCAAEYTEKIGDLYLDDGIHEALAEKFWSDWKSNGLIPANDENTDD